MAGIAWQEMSGLKFILIWICMLPALPVRADPSSLAGVVEFTAAYQSWDGSRFAAASDLFRQATTNAPNNATNYYWLGTALFHRMLQLQSDPDNTTNKLEAAAAMDAAMEALTTAVKLDERHVESHALLATLYGMKINSSLFRAMKFGPRVSKHKDKAMQFGATNPRVQYLAGMCQFHTASKQAGWKEALTTLLAAEALFATESKTPAVPMEPRWGRSICLAFIGRSYELLGDNVKAAEYYRKSLVEHPVDRVAKAGLARLVETK